MSTKPLITPLLVDARPAPVTEGQKRAIFIGRQPSQADNPYLKNILPDEVAYPLGNNTGLSGLDRQYMDEEAKRVVGTLKPDLGVGYADEVADSIADKTHENIKPPSDSIYSKRPKKSGLEKMKK